MKEYHAPAHRQGCRIPIPQQLEMLAVLEPGWLDGDGSVYDRGQLAWVGEQLGAVVDREKLPTPYVYPTPEGYVRAEWSAPQWEGSARFDLGAREVRLLFARLGSDEFVERVIALDEPGAESELGRFLRAHLSLSE